MSDSVRPHRRQPTRLPPSLGFSRQEHWRGLPFPSPMHESEKWKWSRSVVSGPQQPHGLQPSRLLRPWDFPDKSTGVGCHCLLRRILQEVAIPFSRGSSWPRDWAQVSCLQADSLLSGLPGKPFKDYKSLFLITGMGSVVSQGMKESVLM